MQSGKSENYDKIMTSAAASTSYYASHPIVLVSSSFFCHSHIFSVPQARFGSFCSFIRSRLSSGPFHLVFSLLWLGNPGKPLLHSYLGKVNGYSQLSGAVSKISYRSLLTRCSRFCPPGIIFVARSAGFSAVGTCPVKDSPIATDSLIA